MSVWQKMDTAPKDRRILASGLLGLESAKSVGTVKWCHTYDVWELDPTEATEYGPEPCQLDGWQPLPEPMNA